MGPSGHRPCLVPVYSTPPPHKCICLFLPDNSRRAVAASGATGRPWARRKPLLLWYHFQNVSNRLGARHTKRENSPSLTASRPRCLQQLGRGLLIWNILNLEFGFLVRWMPFPFKEVDCILSRSQVSCVGGKGLHHVRRHCRVYTGGETRVRY